MIYSKKLDKASLAFFEREHVDRTKQEVQVRVDKFDVERVSFLLENNYLIIEVSDNEYLLKKPILEKKSFRISLTENCNYKCFFCHEEGMEMGETREEREKEEIYQTSLDAIKNDYLDITFTGGEPLIRWEWIIEFMSRYNDLEVKPDLTIVTNGVLINDELLDAIDSYQGNFKFNFSMHHTDPEKYYQIVLPKNEKKENFEIVTNNIKKIATRGIELKLNFVVLNEINNSREDLECILDYATDNGVDCIKFLEFLVTDKLLDKYNYYFTLDSLYSRIEDLLTLEEETIRTKYYRYKDSDLIVELSHCTCAIGCAKCILAKDVTVTSELKYFPCFFRSSQGYCIDDDFNKSIEEGEKVIANFATEFGDKTPFKVRGEQLLDRRIDYVYTIEKGYEAEFLESLDNLKLEGTREYIERLYGDSPYPGVVKLYKNNHENNYYEVVKELKRRHNKVENTFLYGDKERRVHNLEKYERHLKYIGIRLFGEVEWKASYYSTLEGTFMIRTLNNEKIYLIADYYLDVRSYKGVEEMDRTVEEEVYFSNI